MFYFRRIGLNSRLIDVRGVVVTRGKCSLRRERSSDLSMVETSR